jgi:hypothetical protein
MKSVGRIPTRLVRGVGSMTTRSSLRTKLVSRGRVLIIFGMLAFLPIQADQRQKIFDPPRVVLDYRCPTYRRVVTVDGSVRENWSVELFIQSRSCGPLSTPTLLRE